MLIFECIISLSGRVEKSQAKVLRPVGFTVHGLMSREKFVSTEHFPTSSCS